MRAIMIVAIVAIATTCLAGDSIEALTARLNAQVGGLWINRAQPIFSISSNASATQVVAAVAQAWRIIQGTNELTIIEIREVQLKGPLGPSWKAALVECPLGRKIILFRSEGNDRWWTRFYDVEDDKPNKSSHRLRKQNLRTHDVSDGLQNM